MTKIEELEKRIQKIKGNLETAEQAATDAPAPDRIRRVRKRLKRAQRKLRNLKGVNRPVKGAEAPAKETAEPTKA